METKTTEKEIIFRDENQIQNVISHYKRAVTVMQGVLDALKEQGITITDESLSDLATGGVKLRESVEKQIMNEAKAFKLTISRNAHMETLAPLFKMVGDAAKKVQGIMKSDSGSVCLSIDDFVCNSLKVEPIPDINERITDRYTLYSDSPVIGKAYALANEVQTKANELEMLLREHGDKLHAIGLDRKSGFGRRLQGLINIELSTSGYRYSLNIDHKAFGLITKKAMQQ